MKTKINFLAVGLAGLFFVVHGVGAHAAERNFWAERQKNVQRSRVQSDSPQLAALPRAGGVQAARVIHDFPAVSQQSLTTSGAQKLLAQYPQDLRDRYTPFLTAIPASAGTVRHVSVPAHFNGKTIIHVQDVHMHLEAQNNIAGAIQSLIEADMVGLVALEGGFGKIDLSDFRSFPHQDALKRASDELRDEHVLTGPMHLGLTHPEKIPPFEGVDDWTLYQENVQAFKDSKSRLNDYKHRARLWQNRLEEAKKSSFNFDLIALDQTVQNYRRETLPLGDYISALARSHPKGMGEEVRLFLEALELEKAINFRLVERERRKLIQHLVQKLPEAKMRELLQHSLAYRSGRLLHADFYHFLRTLCRQQGIDFNQFPGMAQYINYVLISDKISPEKLFHQMNRLEDAAFAALVKTPAEAALLDESKEAYLVSKLIDFSLTPEEWAQYQQLTAQMRQAGKTVSAGMDLTSFENFYHKAVARDKAMFNNLLKQMDALQVNTALLVTGGFHSHGMEKLFETEGLASVSFVPRITKLEGPSGAEYLSLLTQEKAPLDKIFSGRKLFLQIQVASQSVFQMLVQAMASQLSPDQKRDADPLIQKFKFDNNEGIFNRGWKGLIGNFGFAAVLPIFLQISLNDILYSDLTVFVLIFLLFSVVALFTRGLSKAIGIFFGFIFSAFAVVAVVAFIIYLAGENQTINLILWGIYNIIPEELKWVFRLLIQYIPKVAQGGLPEFLASVVSGFSSFSPIAMVGGVTLPLASISTNFSPLIQTVFASAWVFMQIIPSNILGVPIEIIGMFVIYGVVFYAMVKSRLMNKWGLLIMVILGIFMTSFAYEILTGQSLFAFLFKFLEGLGFYFSGVVMSAPLFPPVIGKFLSLFKLREYYLPEPENGNILPDIQNLRLNNFGKRMLFKPMGGENGQFAALALGARYVFEHLFNRLEEGQSFKGTAVVVYDESKEYLETVTALVANAAAHGSREVLIYARNADEETQLFSLARELQKSLGMAVMVVNGESVYKHGSVVNMTGDKIFTHNPNVALFAVDDLQITVPEGIHIFRLELNLLNRIIKEIKAFAHILTNA